MKINILKVSFIFAVCVVIILTLMKIVYADIGLTATSTPADLNEGNLNGALIHLILSGDSFIENIESSEITLNNAPIGTSISDIYLVSATELDVILSYNNTHITSDVTNFSITVAPSGIIGNVEATSNTLTISSIPVTLTASTNPYTLNSECLDGSLITLSLSQNTTFLEQVDVIDFVLNNCPENLIIEWVKKIDNNCVELVLSYSENTLLHDVSNFSITLLPNGNMANESVTSNNIFIEAVKKIDGRGTFISTGESYPTKIQIVGFNANNKKLHINFSLTTTKSVSENQTAIFKYFIDVFSNSGTQIGSFGSIDSPRVVNAQQGSKSLDIYNEVLQLESFSNSYTLSVIVVEVEIV